MFEKSKKDIVYYEDSKHISNQAFVPSISRIEFIKGRYD